MLFENFKNYYILSLSLSLRYDIYDFFKIFWRGPDGPVWLETVCLRKLTMAKYVEDQLSHGTKV